MLCNTLHNDLITSMKAKNGVQTQTLRFLISALKNEKINLMKEELPDEDVLRIIQRQVKQHHDSIEQYNAGGRIELAEKEMQELEILKTYLPQMMDEKEVKKVVEEKKTALGITDKSGMGRLMGDVMKELKGKADGNTVKKMVEHILE